MSIHPTSIIITLIMILLFLSANVVDTGLGSYYASSDKNFSFLPPPVTPKGDLEYCTFFNVSTIIEYGQYTTVTTADFNNDGLMDFAASWATSPLEKSGITIFYNNGKDFTEEIVEIFPVGDDPRGLNYIKSLDAADYDGDGDIDLMFTYDECIIYNDVWYYVNGTINLLRNREEGSFDSPEMIAWLGPGKPMDINNRINLQISSADFDGDGDIDFIVGGNSGEVILYLNNGDATFIGSTIYDFGITSWGLANADFNNDGYLDFIVSAENPIDHKGYIYLKINDHSSSCFAHDKGEIIGDTSPSVLPSVIGLYGRTCSLAAVDYNKDGCMDFVSAIDMFAVLWMNKNNSFQPFYIAEFPPSSEGYTEELSRDSLAVGDFNNDGLEDLVVGGIQGFVRVFINKLTLIDIVKPEDRFLYINGEKRISLGLPNKRIIIGNITVLGKELEPLKKVEFYLDGKLIETFDKPPYQWEWKSFSFGKHILTAVAYRMNGENGGRDKIVIWKFL